MSVGFNPSNDDGLQTRPATFGLDTDGGLLTLSCWVFINPFPAPTTYFPMFAKITGSEIVWGIGEYVGGWRQFLQIEGDDGWQTGHAGSVNLSTMGWHHLVVTYDKQTGEVKYYHNGVLSVTRTRTTVLTESSQAVLIGRRSSTQEASAKYEDLAVWSGLLDADKIAHLAKGFVAGHYPTDLTGWWPLHVPGDSAFNEAVASGDLGLQDFSGRGNPCDDTISGHPDWRTATPALHWLVDPFIVSGQVPAGSPYTLEVDGAALGESVGGGASLPAIVACPAATGEGIGIGGQLAEALLAPAALGESVGVEAALPFELSTPAALGESVGGDASLPAVVACPVATGEGIGIGGLLAESLLAPTARGESLGLDATLPFELTTPLGYGEAVGIAPVLEERVIVGGAALGESLGIDAVTGLLERRYAEYRGRRPTKVRGRSTIRGTPRTGA